MDAPRADGNFRDAGESYTLVVKVLLKQLFILSTLSSLVACAGSSSSPDQAAGEAVRGGSDCISKSSVRDYRVLDDRTLVLEASRNRTYLVELSRRVFDLRTGYRLGLKSNTSRVCAGFDEVIVNADFGAESVRISHIRLLSPEEYEELLIRFGKKEPEFEQTPEPAEVEGAEVEELD